MLIPSRKHAIHRLYDHRKTLSDRPFRSRGGSVARCEFCRLAVEFCICSHKPEVSSGAAFMLIMYDDEVLKPSNTARLIADLVADTHAFLWSRTQPDPEMLAMLQDPKWQPYVVFPGHYAAPGRPVVESRPAPAPGKRPLFVMLDGSWREACKMFRKSPYLDRFPLLSFSADTESRYQVRKAAHKGQLATAEVAARVLDLCGESTNADLLDLWFDLFAYRYQQAVHQINQGREDALERLQAYLADKQLKSA